MTSDHLILMGKVAATHGIRGQLRVIPYSGFVDNLASCDHLFLRHVSGRMERQEVSSSVIHGKKLLVSFTGYNDINQVLQFVGSEVLLHKDQLLPLEEDEYYWHDLIGMKVVTCDGAVLGTLNSIIETGSNDVFVVVSEGREFLIPALTDVVSVDIGAGTVTVNPFPGLFDL